ncbi:MULTISPECIES: NAD-dependent epimerase/dehydratase family protein [unclassified Aureimonas]|uniref:NAD-dependent epimerase/dehydratase family protein n=1 Tax=unclassified Aureimonas TaxID=2615206 RepID=UPI0006F8B535|nr:MULTISPECIES: NAD-dependent epimerase/dehydratase family protein [unclassified Aureimonas]KQT55352.1 hypothetical protein ASG62_11080 [Aureimonas sp. Leaf427]KQT71143.1 hypothetical protein ASG54_21465 [Aureimonas sp. Leaf460]
MRILVTGASGFVGRHLVASLRRDGKSVMVLQRGGAALADPDRFAGPADLADLDTWPDWPRDLDAVVHLAALNPSRRQPATPEALAHANVAGTAALVRRAKREGVPRIVFLSTSNVHAPSAVPIDENAPLGPQSPYARSKAEAEAAFWRELAGGETQGCILRPAPVYGRGGGGNVAMLVKLARLPLPLPIEGLGGRRSLLSIDRLLSAIDICLTSDGAIGETFLVADRTPLRPAEIVGALREGWGRRAGTGALPSLLRRTVEGKIGGRGLMADFVLDVSRLSARTGWRPAESTRSELARMAAAGDL